MDIIKKNILSITAGVVALLALVAWIWPLGTIKQEAEAKLAERTKVYSSMQSLLNADRAMPVVSLKSGEVEKLTMFPTQKVIAWGQELTKKLAEEARSVKEIATRLNARPLLVPNTLPVPETTAAIKFRDVYIRYVNEFSKLVSAGSPPTQADIEAASQELWKTKFEPQIIVRDGQPDQTSQQQALAEFQTEAAGLPESVKTARARSILFYMAPQAIDVSAAITSPTGSPPTAAMIWDAQVKIWIQNDVAQAIIQLNSRESKLQSVIDAPVKQLIRIQIDSSRIAGGVAGPENMGGGPMPMGGGTRGAEALPGTDAPPMAMMAPRSGGGAAIGGESFTGRKSNVLYDVVPFRVIVHVEADKLPQFLEELGRNRFITPYDVSLKAVDSVILSSATNVIYGPAPVVEATISCEALLLRDWTVPLMPREVRSSLGVVENAGNPGM